MMPILLVEDCVEDVEALTYAFHKLGVVQQLRRCATGEEALDYLHRRGAYAAPAAAPTPALILLDFNLPGMNGGEILRELKADPRLQTLPVVILSSSGNPRDIDLCYRHGASGYLVKPMGSSDLRATVRSLMDYWFGPSLALPTPAGTS